MTAPEIRVRHLRPVLAVPLEPGQELADLNAGPLFSGEYTHLIRDLDPSPDDQDRMLVLEGLQDELESDYLDAWCHTATKLSASIGVEIHICAPDNLSPQSLRKQDPRVERIRSTIYDLISVDGSGDTWAVRVVDNPTYTAPDTTHAESSRL
jgi:hypothetical protein